MKVDGFAGKGLVNSFRGGDGAVGTLTSPEFVIERKFVTFLIGGGGFAGQTCMNLLVDGKPLRTATGPNTAPGGSEALAPESWDVSELAGKTARIEIVDRATGGWGHINVDHIAFTDRQPPRILENASREIVCDRSYLNLPVKTGAKKRRVSLRVDGAVAREFEIELADGEPDFWSFPDLAPFRGTTATVVVDKLTENSGALAALEVSDAIKGAESLYREPLRPQFHFSARRGWLNDPNGLVFSQGEYHLFFPLNPYGWHDAQKHWGHAVSPDLVHWRELPVALHPPRFGDDAWSGSAVVDKDNTSGFKSGADDLLVAAFTSTGRGECIVYSNDRGRTWTNYEGNPVVRHRGRDPRLLWHAPTKRGDVPTQGPRRPRRGQRAETSPSTSPDLKKWTYQSRVSGFFECPDLFELPVDGDTQKEMGAHRCEQRIRSAASMGAVQAGDAEAAWSSRQAFHAAQTRSRTSRAEGRREIGWGQIAMPGMPF